MTDLDLAAIRQRVMLGINNGSHPVRFSEARDNLNALLAEIDRLNAKLEWFESKFPCDGGCMTVNEAQEDCSQDGRTPRELWDALDVRTRDLQQAQATIQRVREILETSTPELPVELFDKGSVRLARDYARRIESALRALEGGEQND